MALGYKYSWSDMINLIESWKDIARENSGEFKVVNVHSFANNDDPFLRRFEITIPFLDGQIFIITTEFKPLKICYTFNKVIADEFLIYEEDYADKIGKLFGATDIETGDVDFDKKFMIKCDDDGLLKKVLTFDLKKFLLENYVANFKLENANESSTLELNVAIIELDKTKMNDVIRLFKESVEIINDLKSFS